MKRIFQVIFILISVLACKEVFESPPQAFLKATLWDSSTQKSVESKITVWGIGLENLWVRDSVLQEIILPLSDNDTTSYLIWFDSQPDTIRFIHETTQKYASMESGFYYEYKLRSIDCTHHRIDSIRILDSLVTKKWNENIKLYLHPLSVGNN